jgi:hypothetical protein
VITAPEPTGACGVCTHRSACHRSMGTEEDGVTFGNGWCSDCSDCGPPSDDAKRAVDCGCDDSPLILRARKRGR